jgi:ABC-type glutathione transport system ATPase component
VDEVLAVGDASFRQKCIDRIKALLESGTSLIFVSHDMGLVSAVCEKAIYIEHGQVQYTGSSGQVIDHYNQILEKRRVEKMRQADGASSAMEDAEITKMGVLDMAGNPVREVYGDQPIEIRIHYTAFRNIGKANALVRIYRSDGLSVCVLRTQLDDFPVILNRGEGIISVKLEPLQLFGGMYYAIAWMMNAEDSDGMARGTSDWFEVKNRVVGLEAQASVFEPQRQWKQVVNNTNGAPEKVKAFNDHSGTTTP